MGENDEVVLELYLTYGYLPSTSFKVCFQEIIESPHVVFFGKCEVIGDILHDLAHERKTTLDLWRRL